MTFKSSRFFFLLIALLIILPLFILALTANNSYKTSLIDNTLLYMNKSNDRLNNQIIESIKQIELIADIAMDNNIIEFFHSVPSEEKEGRLISYYADLFKSRQGLDDIFLMSLDNVNMMSLKTGYFFPAIILAQEEWFITTRNNPNRTNIISTHLQNYSSRNDNKEVVSFTRMVYDKKNSIIGIVIVDMNIERIINLCQNSVGGNGGHLQVLDEHLNIVFSSAPEELMQTSSPDIVEALSTNTFGQNSATIDGQETLLAVLMSDYTGWKIVNTMPEREVFTRAQINEPLLLILFIIISVIGLSAVLLLFRRYIIKPLVELTEYVDEAMIVEQKGQLILKGSAEIHTLGRSFYNLIKRIEMLQANYINEQKTLRISELKALQAQIKPHFLYNTLDSIVWLAEDKRLEDVITMTLSLSRFFRIGLSKGNDIITIGDEIEHVRNYLIIQEFRYTNKLKYIIDVNSGILQYKIPKLVLQPLVENSIYHGIRNLKGQGLIKIEGAAFDDKIVLTISDNGPGMDNEIKEQLEKILFADNTVERKTTEDIEKTQNYKTEIGLKNVNERLNLLFGKDYGLKIESEKGNGCIIRIVIPIIHEGDD